MWAATTLARQAAVVATTRRAANHAHRCQAVRSLTHSAILRHIPASSSSRVPAQHAAARHAAESDAALTSAESASPFVSSVGEVAGSNATGAPTADLTNDPQLNDVEDLRRQFGLEDPAAPEFKFRSTPATNFWRFGLLVAVPMGLYHLNMTVRQWVDEQIETLSKLYNEKFPAKPRLPVIGLETVRAEEQKPAAKVPETKKPAAAAPAAAAAAPAKAAAKPTVDPVAAAKKAAATKAADALELQTLQKMLEQVASLIEVERTANAGRRVNAVETIRPDSELPAAAAVAAVQRLVAQFDLPALPTPPKWTSTPRTVEEARERIAAIAQFKSDYEIAAQRALSQLREQVANDLTPALRDAFERARADFEQQLPERLRGAETATRNFLESTSLTEFGELSRDITTRKATEWSAILARELADQRKKLEAAMKDVLTKQEKSLEKEYAPSVQEQLKRLEEQKQEIVALEKELGRKKQIEKQGERVHALTSLLIQMEDNLQRDTKAQLFDASGKVRPQATAPAWASELQADWTRMLALSVADPSLHRLVASVPVEYVSATSATPLASPSELRHSFVNVEKAIREATFLPPGEESQLETNPVAALYAKAFSTLSLKEGQALRPASNDTDRLNNAVFYVQGPLKERNLAAAVRELEHLVSPKAQSEALEWLQQAKQRVQVEETVNAIRHNIEATAKTYAKKNK